ncbi:hypothetical protein CHUAL_010220 [Chamberlinius hualienensis]
MENVELPQLMQAILGRLTVIEEQMSSTASTDILRGHAKEWFAEHRRYFYQWEEVRREFLSYFGYKDTYPALISQLSTIKQGSSENAVEYMDRIHSIASRCQPHLQREVLSAFMVNKLQAELGQATSFYGRSKIIEDDEEALPIEEDEDNSTNPTEIIQLVGSPKTLEKASSSYDCQQHQWSYKGRSYPFISTEELSNTIHNLNEAEAQRWDTSLFPAPKDVYLREDKGVGITSEQHNEVNQLLEYQDVFYIPAKPTLILQCHFPLKVLG